MPELVVNRRGEAFCLGEKPRGADLLPSGGQRLRDLGERQSLPGLLVLPRPTFLQ